MFPFRNKGRLRTREAVVTRRQWAIGMCVIIAGMALHALGVGRVAEYWFDDRRAEYFDGATPEPSREVVLVAIDDDSLRTIDLWPIKRWMLAEVVKELDRAGAEVVAFDMLFNDPEGESIIGDVERPETWRVIDGDEVFADAIREHGNVLLATSFSWERTREASTSLAGSAPRAPFEDVFDEVASNPGTSFDELRASLASSGRYSERLSRELTDFDAGAAIEDLRRKYEVTRVMLETADRSSIIAPADGRAWPRSTTPDPPVTALANASAQIASVTFSSFDEDQRVRRVPLWVRQGGRLYPMLGLAAAAAHLGVSAEEVSLIDGDVVIDAKDVDGEARRLEMHAAPIRKQGVKYGLHYLTWPRSALRLHPPDVEGWFDGETGLISEPRGWIGQFRSNIEQAEIEERDRIRREGGSIRERSGDERAIGTRMVAIGKVLDPYLTERRIEENIEAVDRAMRKLHETQLMATFDLGAYEARAGELRRASIDDPLWDELLGQQRALWEEASSTSEEFVAMFEGIDESSLSEEELEIKRLVTALPGRIELVTREIDDGLDEVRSFREKILPRLVGGKICFIGWTATGVDADFVSTSIDPKTPGVLVHMAVANSVLTDHALRMGPLWFDFLVIVALGALGTWIGIRFPVLVGPFALLALVGAVFYLNGAVLWDRMDTKAALGMPILTGSSAWLCVILDRLVVERRGRKRTEARFRSYVSPEVVDILVNNPSLSSMAPQKKELTIFFSDIAGFTSLSEKLGTDGIKELLGVYLGAMTEELQSHRATIDKYIGDAIMAFWGAPVDDPDHARHGALAALGQQRLLAEMNERGDFGPRAGRLEVRMGLATGVVNVGDFGNPPNKSAYTVIGDYVNIAARLESGCKQFGADIMITEETRAKMGEGLLVRPLGRIVVKGKSQPQMIHELIGDRKPKGEATGAWVDATREGVEAYISGDFARSLRAFEKLNVDFGEQRLVEIYRRSIAQAESEDGPLSDFDGSIRLSEK